MRAERFRLMLSSAPALTSASSTLRLLSRRSISVQNSSRWRKRSTRPRASRIDFTAPRPTPLMAESPKRMRSAPTTAKLTSDSLTSGGSTSMPISRHSAMYRTTLSVLSRSDVRSAARKWAG